MNEDLPTMLARLEKEQHRLRRQWKWLIWTGFPLAFFMFILAIAIGGFLVALIAAMATWVAVQSYSMATTRAPVLDEPIL